MIAFFLRLNPSLRKRDHLFTHLIRMEGLFAQRLPDFPLNDSKREHTVFRTCLEMIEKAEKGKATQFNVRSASSPLTGFSFGAFNYYTSLLR